MNLLAFLLALPLSVYLIAGVLQVIDAPNTSRALARLSLRLGVCAGLVLLAPSTSLIWIAAAFLTVVVLHAATTFATRYAIRTGRWPTERVD